MAAPGKEGSWLAKAWLLGALSALAASAPARAEPRDVFYRLGPVELLGDTASYADFGVGVFDLFGEGDGRTSGAAQVQLRWGRKLFFIGPLIGLMANTDRGVFGYGGVYADLAYGNVVLTQMLGLGGYSRGDSKDLAGVFQFRVETGIAYELAGGKRIGARVAHISNAGIHDFNPGEEELYLTLALPI
jgi:lipid A 3-O-deacylase